MSRFRTWVPLSVVLCLVVAAGCAPSLSGLPKATMQYQQGMVADAEMTLKPLEANMKDKNYPLLLLSLGTVQMSLGDYMNATNYFMAGVTNLSAELSGASTAVNVVWKSESSRPYRGFPHEKVLAHTYLGLCFLQQDKFKDAQIEFAKVREEHRGEKPGQEDDFLTAHFLDGLAALRAGKYNDAQVSFRKVSELKPDFALGWYCLARASTLNRDGDEANTAYSKYTDLVPAEHRLALDGSTPCVLVMLDAGWGPFRKPDALIGQFATWSEVKPAVTDVALLTGGDAPNAVVPVDDLAFQAKTEGGFAGDAARKVVSYAAKTALRQIPIFGAFVPKSEADLRCWAISPGEIYLGALPIMPGPNTIEIAPTTVKGVPTDMYAQMLYYIGGRPFDNAQIVYARLLPDADNRAELRTKPKTKKK